MRNAKTWLLSALIMSTALTCAVLVMSEPSSTAQEKAMDAHWRWHDGHWSYFHAGDNRWYYTDGSHWYYNTGTAWAIYPFDRQFGREGFVRGEYRAPGAEIKIELPRHEVFRVK